MYIEIVPNQTFLTELQGSKVDGGALSAMGIENKYFFNFELTPTET